MRAYTRAHGRARDGEYGGVLAVLAAQRPPRRPVAGEPSENMEEYMPRISDIYAGDYITAAQLQGRRVPAVISTAEAEEVGQDRAQKVVLRLRSPDGRAWPRGLVLNKTNGLMLAAAYGDDTAAWIGQAIEVWAEPVQFQGKIVQGVKVAASLLRPQAAAIPLAGPASPNGAAPSSTAPAAPAPSSAAPPPGGPTWSGPGSDLDDEIPF
jgi:hypothetical protein